MKMNTKKTKVMILERKVESQLRIKINNEEIEQVKHYKCLGEMIQSDIGRRT